MPVVVALVVMLIGVLVVAVLVIMVVVVALVIVAIVIMVVVVVVVVPVAVIAVVVRVGRGQRESGNDRGIVRIIGEPVVVARTIGGDEVRALRLRDVGGGSLVAVRVVVLVFHDGLDGEGLLRAVDALDDRLGDVSPDWGGGDDLELRVLGRVVLRAALGAGGEACGEGEGAEDGGATLAGGCTKVHKNFSRLLVMGTGCNKQCSAAPLRPAIFWPTAYGKSHESTRPPRHPRLHRRRVGRIPNHRLQRL